MPLTFRNLGSTTLPVDVASLRIDEILPMAASEISGRSIWHGNQQVPCSDLFQVSGSGDDGVVHFEGDCSRVKSIGAGMRSGIVHVHSNAGAHLGTGMLGGEIRVDGNSGDWTGAEMRNGRVFITGNAGDQLGGAYRGSKRGMAGGEIFVLGSAGNEVGARQRRGVIAVAGNVGDGCGFGMIAGTIIVGGTSGPRCGAGMKRGSIVLLRAETDPPNSTTFQYATTSRPTFLQLYFRHIHAAGFPVDPEAITSRYRMYRGDSLELGLGEVFCRDC
ncbi:formylmethanofuran dehydrogenase subunit C [Planctomicrobium sp. SH661]|uniref:formylmethanofuran dehydrogenase subunit C n=1 Tax=Planctomicrobium sp. SH661 TaxID=3448124 RepID=UPI003F5B321F